MYAITADGFNKVIELCEVKMNEDNAPRHTIDERVAFFVEDHRLLQKRFAKTNILLLNGDFTLVPDAYASGLELKSVLKFATGATQVKMYQHALGGMLFCHNVGQDLGNYLEKHFPNASIRHSGAAAINLLFGQHSLANSDMLLIVNNSVIELLARKGGTLLFYNVYGYETSEDILYYLLFAMEQFQLDPLLVRLSIACQRPVDDELLKSIRKYIKQVSFCLHEPTLELSGELAQLPSHYYFTLLNQHLCEL